MSRDVVTLCHQILLLQPALVCQVQTVTSQGDFLFGQIVPVTVALSTEDVPERFVQLSENFSVITCIHGQC